VISRQSPRSCVSHKHSSRMPLLSAAVAVAFPVPSLGMSPPFDHCKIILWIIIIIVVIKKIYKVPLTGLSGAVEYKKKTTVAVDEAEKVCLEFLAEAGGR